MYFLIESATEQVANGPGISLALVFVIGFIAAAGIGSIAWYNSKRPVGWEDKERPDFVPDVETGQE
jgi:hypothetical protein